MATRVLDSRALLAFVKGEPAAEEVETFIEGAAPLARDRKAELATGDPAFKAVEKEVTIHWLR